MIGKKWYFTAILLEHHIYKERVGLTMRKFSILIGVFAMVLFLTSCAGTSDWSYKLPNKYEVWHINSNEILIKCVDLEESGEKIPSFVKEFSYDERYVFSRNVEDVVSNNIVDETYYALDTLERKVYGPFNSVEELQKKALELDVEIPKKWYRTSPDPNLSE